MNREKFDILICFLSLGRGPKNKQVTVEDAFQSLSGGKSQRLGKALLTRVVSMEDKLKGYSLAKLPSFKLFCKIYDIKDTDSMDAIIKHIETGKPISKIALAAGIYTSPVYSMYRNFSKFHNLRIKFGEL